MTPEGLELFREHCIAMRALGATEIVVGDLRATFPPQPNTPRAMPASAREPRETKSDDDKPPRLDGDGPEDDERRRGYLNMARIIRG